MKNYFPNNISAILIVIFLTSLVGGCAPKNQSGSDKYSYSSDSYSSGSSFNYLSPNQKTYRNENINSEAIYQMTYAFDGNYSKADIKRALEGVMFQYKIPYTKSNYRKVGDVANALENKYGTTAMDLLRCAKNADIKEALYERLDGSVTGMKAYRNAVSLCSTTL